MVYLATRWPYSADAVRLDCIALCIEAQNELRKALATKSEKEHYQSLAMLAFLLGKIQTMLQNVREK